MYAVKVTGPSPDPWTGWVRNGKILNGRLRLAMAEKFKTIEEAEEAALLLAVQQPHLIGRIRTMKLRKTDLDHRFVVECECTR